MLIHLNRCKNSYNVWMLDNMYSFSSSIYLDFPTQPLQFDSLAHKVILLYDNGFKEDKKPIALP